MNYKEEIIRLIEQIHEPGIIEYIYRLVSRIITAINQQA